MGIGQALKTGFSTTFRSFGAVILFFIYNVAVSLVSARINNAGQPNVTTAPNGDVTTTPTAIAENPVLAISAAVITVLVGVFFQAGLTGYVRDMIKEGKASLGSYIKYGMKYYLRFLIIALTIFAGIGVLLVLGTMINAVFPAPVQPIGALLLIVFLCAIVAIAVFLLLSPYIVVVDEEKALNAIKASVRTVRRNFLSILLIGLTLIGVGFLLGVLLGVALGMATIGGQPGGNPTVVAVLSSLVNAFVGALMTSTFMAYYLRLRSGNTPVV